MNSAEDTGSPVRVADNNATDVAWIDEILALPEQERNLKTLGLGEAKCMEIVARVQYMHRSSSKCLANLPPT